MGIERSGMVQTFGSYLLRKPQHAIWLALLCSLLPFLGLPTFGLSILIVAFITLDKGAKAGLLVLLWTALPAVILVFLGQPQLLIAVIIVRGLVSWLLAVILRYQACWTTVFYSAVLLGILGVLVVHLVLPDPAAWWNTKLEKIWHLNEMSQSANFKWWLEKISHFATGLLAAAMLLIDLLVLCLARAWQAKVMNPGGLQKELYRVQMGRVASIALVLAGILGWLGLDWAFDSFILLLLPFTWVGLIIIHAKLSQHPKIKLPILIGLYLSLFLFLPYVVVMLALLGVMDSVQDFRSLRGLKVSA